MTDIPAADPNEARAHFARLLALETDCWDVNAALKAGNLPFVLLDVRGRHAAVKSQYLHGRTAVGRQDINGDGEQR